MDGFRAMNSYRGMGHSMVDGYKVTGSCTDLPHSKGLLRIRQSNESSLGPNPEIRNNLINIGLCP